MRNRSAVAWVSADNGGEGIEWGFVLDVPTLFRILLTSLVFGTFFALYRVLNVYVHEAAYYRPWLDLMPFFWTAYLWGGLPYVILTRALQHDPKADRKQ